ncbi:hypothetical protein NDQ52_00185 [Lactiplantibacillus plantarum]|uniref:hypothetical protein n=1 Tax=Lactiplantibacillus plantarum TaxID=1590 RepID=UPI0020432D86|nr:hypothetical protein [Lactiplantibacillus plantarum]MCM2626671.1 hypothetical protein [Lactiplantibacillus plantarum]
MAKYLKSKEEILNDIRDIARSLTVDDLVSIMNIDEPQEIKIDLSKVQQNRDLSQIVSDDLGFSFETDSDSEVFLAA